MILKILVKKESGLKGLTHEFQPNKHMLSLFRELRLLKRIPEIEKYLKSVVHPWGIFLKNVRH